MSGDWNTALNSARAERQPGWSLSEFLSLLDLRGQTWCIVEIRTSGGLSLPPHDGVWFYSALKGSARIAVASGEVIELTSGQVGMILSGEAHALRTAADSPTETLDFLRADQTVDCPPVFTIGKGPLVARILCGRLHVNWPSGLRRAAMPASVLMGGDLVGRETNLMRRETLQVFASGAGATALLTRMAALLLAISLKAHPQCPLLFRLSATEDPIAHALQLIDADLATDWTIERLARKVGMSRSSFAARFTAQVGRAPMEVITERRMQLASSLLQDTQLKLTEISAKVGYHSEASFTRRFKRFFRLAPGEMRKNFRSHEGPAPPVTQPRLPPAFGDRRQDPRAELHALDRTVERYRRSSFAADEMTTLTN
jgi:AraC-like DNA-binding protein